MRESYLSLLLIASPFSLATAGFFTSPGPYTSANNWDSNPQWPLNSSQTISWAFDPKFTGDFSIYLCWRGVQNTLCWYPPKGFNTGPLITMVGEQDDQRTAVTWKVDAYESDYLMNVVYYFVLRTNRDEDGLQVRTLSRDFNITDTVKNDCPTDPETTATPTLSACPLRSYTGTESTSFALHPSLAPCTLFEPPRLATAYQDGEDRARRRTDMRPLLKVPAFGLTSVTLFFICVYIINRYRKLKLKRRPPPVPPRPIPLAPTNLGGQEPAEFGAPEPAELSVPSPANTGKNAVTEGAMKEDDVRGKSSIDDHLEYVGCVEAGLRVLGSCCEISDEFGGGDRDARLSGDRIL
ncbi:hypothetical protein K458DRAFT_459227 [Lentithecium fluviatile CBS 122367]|uniref:Mid2 domain-containing protein n=1 Tax=Lentithecium fluviatile CBS 122367 TaxID=1168545 RepID=A0A6G1JJ35_9PLEO|nr:hypothetical protein K458DRAFT_459227 [Lentithecium fluviatile CBS 122367]